MDLPANDEAAAAFAREVIAYRREQLADVQCPRTMGFRTELPHHPTCKLYKLLLRREEFIRMGYDPDAPAWKR